MTNNAVDPVVATSFEEPAQPTRSLRFKSASFRKRNDAYLKKALAASLVISLILLVTLLVQTFKKRPKQKEVCATKECTLSAATLLKTLDKTKHPCSNFYSFVCGGFLKENSKQVNPFYTLTVQLYDKIRELLSEKDDQSTSEVVVKARKFYRACMDTDADEKTRLKLLKSVFSRVGGWPIAVATDDDDDASEDNSHHLELVLARLNRIGMESTKIFSVGVSIDYSQQNVSRINLAQYDPSEQTSKRRRRWLEKLADPEESLTLVAAFASLLGNNDTDSTTEQIKEMSSFAKDLKDIAIPSNDRKNFTLRNNKMTIAELHRVTATKFNWRQYFDTLFEGTVNDLNDDEIIVVEDVKFFQRLPEVLFKHSKRTVVNYAVWNALVQPLIPHIWIEGADAGTRWFTACLMTFAQRLPFIAGRMFVDRYSFTSVLKSSEDFIRLLRDSYKEMISGSEWLDSTTKQNAINKLNAMTQHVGYPSWINNDDALKEYYKNVQMGDDHVTNVVDLYEATEKIKLARLRQKPTNKWMDEAGVVNVNAFYDPSANSITFPIGIIQSPFYEDNRIAAMNFGGVGSIIGHEIGHGFDDVGSQFDENGVLKSWWSPESKDEYKKLLKCFVDQYSNYCVNKRDNKTCVDGEHTLGENVPDNTGLKASWIAYKRWANSHRSDRFLPGLGEYTPDQIFFISYSYIWCDQALDEDRFSDEKIDSHSPNKYRVRGATSNSAEFANAFHCPEKTADGRDKRCTMW